jgi:cation:H+ antiporter
MSLGLIPLVLLFLVSAIVTLFAGITLTKTTDTIDHRFRLGDALGGLILLGISGSLPEIAVSLSAALDGQIPIIVGTLLGGLAIQTLVIVIFDLALKGKHPLSYAAGSPILALETYFTISIALIALIGTHLPIGASLHGVSLASLAIVLAWIIGLVFINLARKNPQWNETAPGAAPGRKHHERRAKHNHPFYAGKSTLHVILIFLFASALTLVAGIALEKTGSQLAQMIGMDTGIFAATFIALVASLPEISAGLESLHIGDNQLAISDVMGGNAFMLTLFILTDLVMGKPTLAYAGTNDALLTVLAIILMSVYAAGFLFRPPKKFLKLGPDSLAAACLYFLGLYALGFL